jgi:hypothetical protein
MCVGTGLSQEKEADSTPSGVLAGPVKKRRREPPTPGWNFDASASAFMTGVLQYVAAEVMHKAVEQTEDKRLIKPAAIRAALVQVRVRVCVCVGVFEATPNPFAVLYGQRRAALP